MLNVADSEHPLFTLVGEIGLLHGRFKSAFAPVRKAVDLGETEMTVLSSVARASAPLTAARIGRSLGIARQLVQRAANSLMTQGLIEAAPNPDHKRAQLLVVTAKGQAVMADADKAGARIVAKLGNGVELSSVAAVAEDLRKIRNALQIELQKDGRF